MANVTVGMTSAPPSMYGHAAIRWDVAGIKRATRRLGKISQHDPRVRLPRSDKVLAIAAEGRGMTWEEAGRTFKAQAWCPGPNVRSYWYLVMASCAYFPGELRLVDTSDNGEHAVLHDRDSYTAQGHKAHRHDGSPCFGYQIGGCPGCKLARKLAPGKTDIIQGHESDVPEGACGWQTAYGLPWSEYCIAPAGHDPDHRAA